MIVPVGIPCTWDLFLFILINTKYGLIFMNLNNFQIKQSFLNFISQAEINRVVKDNKFHSTSDKGFESAVTCIVSFLSGLQHTPTTRDKVKQRVKKRIYNQQSYQKTK